MIKQLKKFLILCIFISTLGVAGIISILWYYSNDLPDYKFLKNYKPPISSKLYSNDGQLLSEFSSEKRIFVPYNSIPALVINSFLSAEDKNFFKHPGVVAKINPFNHPLRFCAEKSAAALAAGNTVVVKASEQAPLSSLRFAEICEEVLPPGVVNVLTGDKICGDAMVRHPYVRRVGVVGSVATGKIIAKAAAEDLTHVTLELGGKNPIIIFPDANPKQAASYAVKGMNMNRQGQSCSSTSRVLVHQDLHDAVLEEMVQLVEKLPVGLPWIEENELGPVVSEIQYKKILGFIS